MQQIGSTRTNPSGSSSGRASIWITLIGMTALVVIFVVALLQAANQNSVLGWVLAAIALGWLLIACFVLWMVRKAAKFGARQIEQAQQEANRRFGRAPMTSPSTTPAADRSILDQKLEHSFQIIMVQARVIAANLPAPDGSTEGDREQVDRALDTLAVTASNGMGMVKDASEPLSGEVIDDDDR
ncbi:hypothetical protein FCK90_05745 [Kocuria coralli]|uniref:Uncharacterized protein n=1 Tax=Kocuria coralli TaxID=1461025 RepID=A0A5J5L145_9MICC|nr:hypothetical protein [Kocuria coralli]KAA9394671.1 hypothetical protein FCK90_05745 [Kocuria coralli]